MTAQIIYGKLLADTIYQDLLPWVNFLKVRMGRAPSLHVVLIGDHPASLVYVSRKQAQCQSLGITSQVHRCPADMPMADVASILTRLNQDDTVDGILVQMPLPSNLDSTSVLGLIAPEKDVDGLTPFNLGSLFIGAPGLRPCTPLGVMHILQHIWGDVAGKHVVIKGRSILVGRSLATMLMHANATVTLMHSHSKNTRSITQQADAIVMAVGRPGSLVAEDIHPGVVVIDVGINRQENESLVGDVDPGVAYVAGYLTPVPGGVGPMTIAALMANTVRIACDRWILSQKELADDHEFNVFKRTHPFPIGYNF